MRQSALSLLVMRLGRARVAAPHHNSIRHTPSRRASVSGPFCIPLFPTPQMIHHAVRSRQGFRLDTVIWHNAAFPSSNLTQPHTHTHLSSLLLFASKPTSALRGRFSAHCNYSIDTQTSSNRRIIAFTGPWRDGRSHDTHIAFTCFIASELGERDNSDIAGEHGTV